MANVYTSLHANIGVWQGVATGHGVPKLSPGTTCSTFLRPAGRPPLKQPYGCFWGGPPTGCAACGHLLPHWTPHAVRLRVKFGVGMAKQGVRGDGGGSDAVALLCDARSVVGWVGGGVHDGGDGFQVVQAAVGGWVSRGANDGEGRPVGQLLGNAMERDCGGRWDGFVVMGVGEKGNGVYSKNMNYLQKIPEIKKFK
jgi:hypothetical protein